MFYDVKQEKSATILFEKNPVAQRKRVGENLRTHFWNRGGNSDQNVNVCLDKFKLRIFLHRIKKTRTIIVHRSEDVIDLV